MTNFWTRHPDGYNSEKVDSITKLLGIRNVGTTFYAQGDNINFEEFFSIEIVRMARCIVFQSNIPECFIKGSSHRTGFKNEIVFQNCKIKDFKLIGMKIPTISFNNCEIENIEVQDCREINEFKIIEQTSVDNIKITNDCNIIHFAVKNAKSIGDTIITGCQIPKISIQDSTLGKFVCHETQFIRDLSIEASNFEKILFQQTPVHEKLSLTNCTKGDLEFNLCELNVKDLYVINCSIKLTFHKVRDYKKIIFRINNSQASKIYFKRCYFSDEVLFQGEIAYAEKNLFISDTVFRDLVLFDDDNAKSLVIKESLFQKGLLLPIPKVKKITEIDSSVWCILKNQSLSRNENIKAIEYRKNELTSYTKELRKTGTKLQERIVLFFNKISNNHGINWFLGILFTVFTWLVFYSLFVMSVDNFYCLSHKDCSFLLSDRHFWAGALNFLWIPQGLNDLSNGLKGTQSCGILIIMIISFILGKIFIAYGVFQTISAFRRHGKA